MPSSTQEERAERRVERFKRLVLKSWQLESIEDMPTKARLALLKELESVRRKPRRRNQSYADQ